LSYNIAAGALTVVNHVVRRMLQEFVAKQ